MYLAVCILFVFLPSSEAIKIMVGKRTLDRICKCFEAIQKILYPQCLRSGMWACLVLGVILFCSHLLTSTPAPIPNTSHIVRAF